MNHQRLERSVKYGLLFVGLTFACFFFFDALKQRAIHPIQYGLVGAALVLFYLLLTSLADTRAVARYRRARLLIARFASPRVSSGVMPAIAAHGSIWNRK